MAYDKAADFIGREGALAERETGGALRFRCFVVKARDADVIGDEPISHKGKVVGWVTSGGFAHGSGVSVAQGYVPKDIADEIDGWEIELLDQQLPATLQAQPCLMPIPDGCEADTALTRPCPGIARTANEPSR